VFVGEGGVCSGAAQVVIGGDWESGKV